MEKRPEFNEILSYSEFKKYYWYRKELISICRQLNIDASGTKQELNHNIEEYFCGNLVKKQKNTINQNKTKKEEFSLDCPLLECGFSFNRKFREFFSIHTGIKNFKFTADMAEMWRKVKRTNDKTITLGDMLEVYYGKSDYARYDRSSCQWNQFLKDFCGDHRNSHLQNKLKAAAILWNIVRESALPKVYSYCLVEKYSNLFDN